MPSRAQTNLPAAAAPERSTESDVAPQSARACAQGCSDPALGTWDDIVRAHRPGVLRRAYRLTGNRHDAEDLTQDVLVRVFTKLSTYRPGNFEAWLSTITTNLHRDRLRRARIIRFTPLSDPLEQRLPAAGPGPAELLEAHTLDPDVRSALQALPPKFLAVVALRDLDGLSYEQVGAALGVGLGTVRSRLHRGRARLREDLAHRAPSTHTGQRGLLEQAA